MGGALALCCSESVAQTDKGAEVAEDINKQIVKKIQEGEIKSIQEAKGQSVGLLFKKAREMKDDKMSESEIKTMNEKLKEYEMEWEKLIKEKNKK